MKISFWHYSNSPSDCSLGLDGSDPRTIGILEAIKAMFQGHAKQAIDRQQYDDAREFLDAAAKIEEYCDMIMNGKKVQE